MFDLSTVNKAVAGGIVGAILTVASHYGFQPKAEDVTALGVIVSAIVGYVAGHIAVYIAPKIRSANMTILGAVVTIVIVVVLLKILGIV